MNPIFLRFPDYKLIVIFFPNAHSSIFENS